MVGVSTLGSWKYGPTRRHRHLYTFWNVRPPWPRKHRAGRGSAPSSKAIHIRRTRGWSSIRSALQAYDPISRTLLKSDATSTVLHGPIREPVGLNRPGHRLRVDHG